LSSFEFEFEFEFATTQAEAAASLFSPRKFRHTMASLDRIVSGNISGRARSPRYVQSQLQKFYDVLQDNKAAFKKALATDGNKTMVEVELELHLALDSIKCQYDSIDFDQLIQEEYNVARGENANTRCVPHGIVYVQPAHHTLLYSAVSASSAAICAGNCVVIEVSRVALSTQGKRLY